MRLSSNACTRATLYTTTTVHTSRYVHITQLRCACVQRVVYHNWGLRQLLFRMPHAYARTATLVSILQNGYSPLPVNFFFFLMIRPPPRSPLFPSPPLFR